MENKPINLKLSDFENEGLYLIFPDSTRLELTKINVESVTEKFWQDTSKISSEMRKAIDFQKCYFCPRKNKEDVCDSIRPVLPFLDNIDKYVSFDKVTAAYKSSQDDLLHIKETTMQEALQYVSLLSLLRYNMVLRKYWKYYYGIIPLMNGQEVACRVYINMYWFNNGNEKEIDKLIEQFREELRVSSKNQVKRLSLVCKNDAFMNAFVNTQIVSEFLTMNIKQTIAKSLDKFEKSYTHHF